MSKTVVICILFPSMLNFNKIFREKTVVLLHGDFSTVEMKETIEVAWVRVL